MHLEFLQRLAAAQTLAERPTAETTRRRVHPRGARGGRPPKYPLEAVRLARELAAELGPMRGRDAKIARALDTLGYAVPEATVRDWLSGRCAHVGAGA